MDVLGCGTKNTESTLQLHMPDKQFKKGREKKVQITKVHSRAPTNHQTRAYHQCVHSVFMCKGAAVSPRIPLRFAPVPDLRTAKGQAALELARWTANVAS